MHKKECEVLVVGGGIAGVAITEILSRSGHKAILIEEKISYVKRLVDHIMAGSILEVYSPFFQVINS